MNHRFHLVCCLLWVSLHTHAEIPIEHFARLPAFSDPVISPKGSMLAAHMTLNSERHLFLMEFHEGQNSPLKPVRRLSKVENIHFQDYQWANENVLLATIRTTTNWSGRLWNVTRLVLVPKEKTVPFEFIRAGKNKFGRPRQFSSVVHMLPRDEQHILVSVDEDYEATYIAPEVHKVDVDTARKQRVQKNIHHIYDWISDSEGNVRVGVSYRDLKRDTDQVIYVREPGKKLSILNRTGFYDDTRLYPVGFEKGNDNVLLMAPQEKEVTTPDEDRHYLRFDLQSGEMLGPYINEAEELLLQRMRKALPEFKVAIASKSEDEKQYVFRLKSDTKVPVYMYHNTESDAYVRLPSPYPELVGQQFSAMQETSYTARDGMTIPAFLTVPHDSPGKNLPTVVFPHGGPWSRDEWGFNTWVQFFADRGFAVLQPQFRGSTGYGSAHEKAGYEQWGRAIQDDITDGVEWLIDEGIADPDKICIVGVTSFGGYAAAMGLAKTPELYQCGVSIAGVQDFKRYIEDHGDYLFSGIKKAKLNSKKDSREVSPYHLVDNIEAPLLLIHGDKDTMVPYFHSRKMYKALKKRKRAVELIKLKGAEHWSTSEAHELTKFKAVDAFLAQYLE